ncbi:MAG: sigma-70 family RNA polymerase sigma factor [Thermoanaerobaculia bacterium]
MSQPLLEVRPHLATLADGRVVERVLEGEIELFEILMRRYNQRLYRVTRSVVDSAQEAEDVVQEAWVRTFDKLATFRGEASFATWVTRIAVHEALARVRRRRPTTPLDDAFPPPRPGPRGPEADTANDELAALLREAIATLPRSLRPVFVLREVEGLGAEEIGAARAPGGGRPGAPTSGEAAPAPGPRHAPRRGGAPSLPLRRSSLRPARRAGLRRTLEPRAASRLAAGGCFGLGGELRGLVGHLRQLA